MKMTDWDWRGVCVCLMGEVRWRDAMRGDTASDWSNFGWLAWWAPKLDDAPPDHFLKTGSFTWNWLSTLMLLCQQQQTLFCVCVHDRIFCLLSSSWTSPYSPYRELIVLISCLLIIHGASLKAAPPALLLQSYFFILGLAYCLLQGKPSATNTDETFRQFSSSLW